MLAGSERRLAGHQPLLLLPLGRVAHHRGGRRRLLGLEVEADIGVHQCLHHRTWDPALATCLLAAQHQTELLGRELAHRRDHFGQCLKKGW